MALQGPLNVGVPQVGVGDDTVREPRPAGCLLEPLGLSDRVLGADGGLDVDGLDYVGVAGLRDVVLGEVAPLGQPLYLLAQERVRDPRLPVSVEELRVLHVVEVDVGVDEVKLGHYLSLLPAFAKGGRIQSVWNTCWSCAIDWSGRPERSSK